ncbi:putative glycerol kinase 5, partial [Caerostris extrusa]
MSNNLKNRQIILGVDIGTTNIKCCAYDESCNVIGEAHEKITVLDPGDGRHEIEPDFLWDIFQTTVKRCLLNSNLNAADISCIGISTQRATFLTWNRKTCEPFHNFITWKDKRSEKLCEQWNSSILIKHFEVYSGHGTNCDYIGCLKYDKKISNKIFHDEALFGTIDTWLVWKLTGGKVHATDASNASVTGFFDIFK